MRSEWLAATRRFDLVGANQPGAHHRCHLLAAKTVRTTSPNGAESPCARGSPADCVQERGNTGELGSIRYVVLLCAPFAGPEGSEHR